MLIHRTKLGRLSTVIRPGIDRLPIRLYRNRTKSYFSTGLMTGFNTSLVNKFSPDIINLHNVAEGFLSIGSLKQFSRHIVWTLHDSWPFTGGCHLHGDCVRYQQSCGACPILGSKYFHDLSYWIWRKKIKAWDNLNMTIVTDSTWLEGCVKRSSLFRKFRVVPINPGLDLTRYIPVDKGIARSLLSTGI